MLRVLKSMAHTLSHIFPPNFGFLSLILLFKMTVLTMFLRLHAWPCFLNFSILLVSVSYFSQDLNYVSYKVFLINCTGCIKCEMSHSILKSSHKCPIYYCHSHVYSPLHSGISLRAWRRATRTSYCSSPRCTRCRAGTWSWRFDWDWPT